MIYSSTFYPALRPPIQAKKVRAQFDKSCELVEKTSAKLKAKTAFITFGSEEGYEQGTAT